MSEEAKNDWKERECGALWTYTSEKTGTKYSSGYVEVDGKKVQVVVMRNTLKQAGEKTPDARIYLDTRDGAKSSTQPKVEEEDEICF